MRKSAKNYGFTLVELSVVLIIIALIIASTAPAYVKGADTARFTATKNKLVAITTALNTYYAKNHRLPCPASGSVTSTTAAGSLTTGQSGFGLEIYTTNGVGACDLSVAGNSGNTTLPTGTFRYLGNDGASYIRQGTLPIKVLGLPDDMMYDGYKNKFTYAVTEKFTTSAVAGIITVNDGISSTAIPNSIMNNAVFVVVSHGKDGDGAWSKTGTRNACNTNKTRDMENCGSYATAGNRSAATTSTDDYYFTDSTFNDFKAEINTANWFDDIVTYENENSIIGLTPNSMLGVKLISPPAGYQGNGSTINLNPCSTDPNAGAGYKICTAAQLKSGILPSTSAYYIPTISPNTVAAAWIDGNNGVSSSSLNCSNWSGGTYGATLTMVNGAFSVNTTTGNTGNTNAMACSTYLPVACCQHNVIFISTE